MLALIIHYIGELGTYMLTSREHFVQYRVANRDASYGDR